MARKITLVLLNIVVGFAIVMTAYLLSILSDYFPWGNSKREGLFLLVIPIYILPTVIVCAIINFLLIRKSKNWFIKYIQLIIVLLLTTVVLITFQSTGESSLMASIMLLLAGVVAVCINIGMVLKAGH